MAALRHLRAAATFLAVLLPCAVVSADTLVVAFDPQGETTSITTSSPYQEVTAYLLLLDPSGDENINAWECTVETHTGGPAPIINWTTAASGLNIMTPPEFIVGLPVPLPNTDVVLLATAQVLVPQAGQEISFHILPSSIPSLIQPPGYPVQQPDWAPPPGQGFVMAPPASGCSGMPVAVINDDGVEAPLTVTLAGDGDFGVVEVGSQVTRTLQLHNGGSTTICGLLTVTGADFQSRHDGGPWTAEPTWVRLAPGATRAVDILYSPTVPGPHAGDLTLACAGPLASIALSGGAQLVACDVTPTAVDFGSVELGSVPTRTVTVANVGTVPLQGVVSLAAGAFQVVAGGGAFAIAAGDTHRVVVSFSPPAEAGYDAVLQLGTTYCGDVPLHGVGVDTSPICQVAPPELDAGETLVGVPAIMSLLVSNLGESPMSVNPVMSSPVFSITQGGGPQVVAPGGSLQVRIQFLANEPGVYDGMVLIGSSYCADVPVTGTAMAAVTQCDWNGLALADFGEHLIGSPTDLEVEFRNTGTLPLTDVTFSVVGAAFAVTGGAGPVTLVPGASHQVRVTFSPQAAGYYTGELVASTGSCDPLPLAGRGTRPPLEGEDAMVVAFDPQGETTSITTSAPYQEVTAYLLLRDPSGSETINAWECTVETQTSGPAPVVNWTVAANGLNIMQPPEFIVGLPVPLPNTDVVLLATAQVLVPQAGQEISFHLLPSSLPSLIQPPGYPVQQPDWAPPPGQGFVMAPPASGCTGMPVSVINDDGVDPPLVVTLTGDGDFGLVEVGSQVTRTLQLHNAGSVTVCGLLTLTGVDFQSRHDGGPWTAEPTWVRLAPGATRAVDVVYSPTVPGPHAGDLTLDCAGSLASIALSGGAQLVACDVTPTAVDFGSVELGSVPTRTVTVANVGTVPLQGVVSLAVGAFQVVAGGGAFAIAAGDTHRVVVSFSPQAEAGYDAVLQLGTTYCGDVPLHGVGVDTSPICQVAPPELAAGETLVGVPAITNLLVSNLGESPMQVNPVMSSPVFSITQGGGPQVVAPGGSLQVRVQFLANEPGVYDAVVLIGSSYCADVPVTGTAMAAVTQCDWNGLELGDIGEHQIGSQTDLEVEFRNTGTLPLTDVTFSVVGAAFAVTGGAGPVTMAPGATHPIRVTFSPQASMYYEGELVPSTGSCDPLPLAGSGTAFTPSSDDAVVVAFDPQGETTSITTSAPYQEVTAYLLLIDPSGTANINAWECTVETHTSGPTPVVNWTVAANGLNIMQPPEFIVGLPVPLPNTDVVLLATAQVLVPQAGQEISFHLLPSSLPSLIQPPGYPVQQPDWAPPPGQGFVMAPPASGCTGMPVSVINDDGVGAPLAVTFTGDGDFGLVEIGSQVTRTLQLHNAGSVTVCGLLSLTGMDFQSRHDGGPWTAEPTWVRLAPGATRAVEVLFWPSAPGPHAGSLVLDCAGALATMTLTGQAQPGACEVSPTSVDFGVVELGAVPVRVVTVSNRGTVPLQGNASVAPGPFHVTGAGPFTVEPGGNHPVVVSFAPQAEAVYDAVLQLGTTDCGDVPLHGVGVDTGPICHVAPPELDAGEAPVGAPTTVNLLVSNLGESSMSVNPMISSPVFSITQGGGPHIVAPGGSLQVRVQFLANEPGVYDGVVLLGSSDCADVPVTGTATVGVLACDWNGLELADFGEQDLGTETHLDIQYRNTGSLPLTNVTFSVVGAAFVVTGGAGPVTVAPGASHQVRVTFYPQASGSYTGLLVPSVGTCDPLPLAGRAIVPQPSQGDGLVVAFDPLGETTTYATSSPNQAVTAYLLLISRGNTTALYGWECTVEVETVGPAPAISWTVANNGLNIGTPPVFIVGMPISYPHSDVTLLATATVYVPNPDQEISFHVLPSPLPSLWDPPGYRVQQPIWVGAPGSPFIVAPPLSGCSGQPVSVINDDGGGPPLYLNAAGDGDFGAVPVGSQVTRTITVTNPYPATMCGTLTLGGNGYDYKHGPGDWTTLPTWCRIAPGASLDVQVRFSPFGSGPFYGDLVVESCGPLLVLPLTGGGNTAPPVSLAPRSLDFAWTPPNDVRYLTCTVRNDGDAPLGFSPRLVAGQDFALADDTTDFVLEPGGSQPVVVRFSPTEPGAEMGRVAFGQPAAPDLLLQGTTMPVSNDCLVLLDGGGTGDCGEIAVGRTIVRTATIHNVGTEVIAGDIGLVGDLEAFALTEGGGWVELAPGATHVVTVAVTPPAIGPFAATLRTLGGCYNVNLEVAGVPAVLACTVAPTTLDFGVLPIGQARVDTVTVTNAGTLPFNGQATVPPGPFAVTAGSGPFTLEPGRSRLITVTFTPATVGIFAATLDLGADACASVPCLGTGREYGPYCVVSPEAVDGGVVPATVPVDFPVTVRNLGELPLSVNAQIAAIGFSIVTGGGPRQVAPGGQLEILVRFVGPEPGVFTASLDLGTLSCTDVPITVTARAAILSCAWGSPNPLDAGEHLIGTIDQFDVTLENTGDIALPGVRFAFTGEGFHIVTGEGPVTIPCQGIHTIQVAFIPTNAGTFTAQLATSIACCEPLTIFGEGSGSMPSCSVDPPQITFGPTCVGNQRTATVQVSNAGPGALVVFPAVEGAAFTAAWTTGYPLWLRVPANSSRSIVVTFAPTAAGDAVGVLSLGDTGCIAVPLAGTAIEGQPICAVDAEALDFGEIELGYFAERPLQVTNEGCTPLAIAPAVSGPGFLIVAGGEAGQIAPSTSRTIVVRLAPAGLGPVTGMLDLGTSDCPGVSLSGACIPVSLTCYTLPAYLNVDFLALSQVRVCRFAIFNGGSTAVPFTVADMPGLAHVVAGGGTFSLQPGATHVVQATFQAPALGQTIWQWSFGAACRPLMVVVYGADAICHARPAYIDFGTTTVGSTVVRNWVVSNPGVATATYTVDCEDPNYTWSPTGTQTLAPGHAFSGQVTFAPQAAGTHDARLEFNSETAYPSDLHGVAVQQMALRRFDVERLDFGAVGPDEALTRGCVLLNDSDQPLSGVVTLSGREFTLVDGAGPISVPAGDHRTIRVRYASAQVGVHAATLTLAGTDLAPVKLDGRCFVAASDSNRVTVVWDDGVEAMAASSDLFAERELAGRLVLRDPGGTAGLFAWQGRLITRGDGHFTTWQLPAGATNRAEAPAFDVVMNGDLPPLAPEITLATFRYVVPAGGQAEFLLAGAAGEEPVGWPIWLDAAEPDSVLVAPSADGEHLVAMINPRPGQVVPGLTRLEPPYPNPFNPLTNLAFELGEPGQATLALFDLAGRQIATVVDADLPAGRHTYVWQGRDDGGRAVPSGTYHVRLVAGGRTQTRKLSLIR